METWLVLIALGVGLLIGAGGVFVFVRAAQHGERVAAVASPRVPDGVDQVMETLESAGVVLDPSNNVVAASPGAQALGLVADRRLVHHEIERLVDRARRDGDPVSEEHVLRRGPFGRAQVHLHVRAALLGSRYVLLLVRDDTEAVRLEEVRRDFIANVSHELKTPIGAVGVLADALAQAADDPAQVKRFADRLSLEGKRLQRITRDIIQLSRLQSVDLVERPRPVLIDEVVAAAVDAQRVEAAAGDVAIVMGDASGARVMGDEATLTTAVENLVSNAVHYSPRGGRVGVGVTVADGAVQISVTDQGIGIPEGEVDRVFERFYRVDPARSRNTGGSGLGLAIVKHIIQNHGGDVSVWSQTGRGSTFTIRLPEASAVVGIEGDE